MLLHVTAWGSALFVVFWFVIVVFQHGIGHAFVIGRGILIVLEVAFVVRFRLGLDRPLWGVMILLKVDLIGMTEGRTMFWVILVWLLLVWIGLFLTCWNMKLFISWAWELLWEWGLLECVVLVNLSSRSILSNLSFSFIFSFKIVSLNQLSRTKLSLVRFSIETTLISLSFFPISNLHPILNHLSTLSCLQIILWFWNVSVLLAFYLIVPLIGFLFAREFWWFLTLFVLTGWIHMILNRFFALFLLHGIDGDVLSTSFLTIIKLWVSWTLVVQSVLDWAISISITNSFAKMIKSHMLIFVSYHIISLSSFLSISLLITIPIHLSFFISLLSFSLNLNILPIHISHPVNTSGPSVNVSFILIKLTIRIPMFITRELIKFWFISIHYILSGKDLFSAVALTSGLQ